MTPQFSNITDLSFFYWLQNEISTKGQTYFTGNSQLFYYNDTRLPSPYVTFNAPFKQWMIDSGITFVPNSVSGSFGTLTRGQSGLMFDYDNGRVIMTGVGTGLAISGSYTFKEFNYYLSNETQEQVIFNTNYYLNPRFAPGTGAIPPYTIALPAVFVCNLNSNNTPFSFGGEDQTVQNYGLVFMAENINQINALKSICRDATYKYIPQLQIADDPINEWGDFKNGTGFAYSNLVALRGSPNNLYRIDRVMTSTLSDRWVKPNYTIFMGLADFDISRIRYPHI